jgi:hypothetical protein
VTINFLRASFMRIIARMVAQNATGICNHKCRFLFVSYIDDQYIKQATEFMINFRESVETILILVSYARNIRRYLFIMP